MIDSDTLNVLYWQEGLSLRGECRTGLDQNLREFARAFSQALSSINLHPNTHFRQDKGQYCTQVCSVVFYRWYQNLSLDDLEKLLANEELIKAFVKGFYESEGTCGTYAGYGSVAKLEFWNTDKSLLEMVQRLLRKLGFEFTLYGPYKPRKKHWKSLYCLSTKKRSQVIEFLRTIKPCVKNELSGEDS